VIKNLIQGAMRSIGYEVARYPTPDWLRYRNIIRDVLGTLSITCIVDVGANVGQYATVLRSLGYAGWIISFEPVLRNLEQLRKASADDPKWRVFPWALGRENGTADINVMKSSVFSSFLQPDPTSAQRFDSANCVVATERVEIRRLDGVLSECLKGIESPRIFLKVDTQGSDLQVLDGAEAILPRILALQTEVAFHRIYLGMPEFLQSMGQLMAKGFEVVDFVPVTREHDRLRVIEMDCIMLRSASAIVR
jgi:FkbM family methyltransferase